MKIIDNTAAVLSKMNSLIDEKLNIIEENLLSSAKRRVVVKSGKLQRSITTKIEDNELTLGSPLPYAPIIEAEQPFLRPALVENKDIIKKVFTE